MLYEQKRSLWFFFRGSLTLRPQSVAMLCLQVADADLHLQSTGTEENARE